MPKWQNSTRRDRLPPDWLKIRKRVWVRDQGLCQWRGDDGRRCLAPARDVDHIKRGDDHRLENLRCLCERHHKFKTSQEGAEAANAKRRQIAGRYTRTEEHPGLL